MPEGAAYWIQELRPVSPRWTGSRIRRAWFPPYQALRRVRGSSPEAADARRSRPMPSSSRSCLPTGRQIRLTHGDQELVVVEVGGGIRTYRQADADVIDGYAGTEMSPGGRGQVLAPWPNRVGDGRYEWEGQAQQLALTEPENHNAIHGLVRWSAWSVTDEQDDRVASPAASTHSRDGSGCSTYRSPTPSPTPASRCAPPPPTSRPAPARARSGRAGTHIWPHSAAWWTTPC